MFILCKMYSLVWGNGSYSYAIGHVQLTFRVASNLAFAHGVHGVLSKIFDSVSLNCNFCSTSFGEEAFRTISFIKKSDANKIPHYVEGYLKA